MHADEGLRGELPPHVALESLSFPTRVLLGEAQKAYLGWRRSREQLDGGARANDAELFCRRRYTKLCSAAAMAVRHETGVRVDPLGPGMRALRTLQFTIEARHALAELEEAALWEVPLDPDTGTRLAT